MDKVEEEKGFYRDCGWALIAFGVIVVLGTAADNIPAFLPIVVGAGFIVCNWPKRKS